MTAYGASLDKGSEITHSKKIIIENIPSGNATGEQVAEELGISARKLQRLPPSGQRHNISGAIK